ncbi:MAG: hypothetical protein AAF092_04505 [Pseudomonadota bacterium]
MTGTQINVRKRKRRPAPTDELALETAWRLNALVYWLSGAEFKLVHHILSATLLNGRWRVSLSYNEIRNGVDDKRGRIGGVNMCASSIITSMRSLIERGLVTKHQSNGRVPNAYAINIDGLHALVRERVPEALQPK